MSPARRAADAAGNPGRIHAPRFFQFQFVLGELSGFDAGIEHLTMIEIDRCVQYQITRCPSDRVDPEIPDLGLIGQFLQGSLVIERVPQTRHFHHVERRHRRFVS